MFFFPFLALLMVAIIGHASGEETLPIPLIADFHTEILSPLQTFCQSEGAIKGVKIHSILCELANALDRKFIEFGKIIMEQMNMEKLVTNETEHTIFATIKTHIENDLRLKMTTLAALINEYHKFVIEVANEIVHSMTYDLNQYIAKRWIGYNQVHKYDQLADKEIGEKRKNAAPGEKIEESLKYILLKYFNVIQTTDIQKSLIGYTYAMQYVATKIYEIYKSDHTEKQLAFSLDLFVANLIYIEKMFPMYHLNVSRNWQMRMMTEP